jgi:FkbM family methyltransferase
MEQIDNHFFYNPHILPQNPIIVEVGSFTGKNGISLLSRFPESTIVIYEASSDNFKLLSNSLNEYPQISIHNKAITGFVGEITLYEFEGAVGSSSIYERPEIQKKRKLHKQYPVRCIDLYQALVENKIEKIDLLLLNCEGSETQILKSISGRPDLMKKIQQICVSFHDGRIYPSAIKDKYIQSLKQYYTVISNDDERLEYVLFYHE